MSRRSRAIDRELARTRRREILGVLLSRAERGVLLADEARLLRASVEAEIAEHERARRTAGGYSAAVRRLHAKVEAADAAIVETEAERDRLARDIATLHDGLNIAAREAFAERKRHRAEVYEAHLLVETAEARAERAEQKLAEQEATALRYANWLVDAQQACGAPNWPQLADTVRAAIRQAAERRTAA
ncbi:hypothetical protein AB0A70_00490 [Streptomyces morookaense]|uniref:hypothetical protein n=1 Tax=Streptomyces morookaense TaxID=1970 RepID=UPI0033C776B6